MPLHSVPHFCHDRQIRFLRNVPDSDDANFHIPFAPVLYPFTEHACGFHQALANTSSIDSTINPWSSRCSNPETQIAPVT